MKIYVDFDDCICETARAFSVLAAEMFDIHVPYEKMHYFELDKSFDLNEKQYEQLMIKGHQPDVLLAYEETAGASMVINEWISAGHEVSIITGRPAGSYEASREWLDRHGLQNVRLFCLDKYGRDAFLKNSEFTLKLEEYYKMQFDFAVEDSPRAFKFFDHLPNLKVLVFDRPWNRKCEFDSANYIRCSDWRFIKEYITLE